MSDAVTLTLPYPVSANRYWRPVNLGKHISIVPTKEAKAYRATVAWMAKAAGIRKPIEGRVAVEIDLYPHRPLDYAKRMRTLGACWDDTVQCIDLGNCEKVLGDALKNVVFNDDKWLWDIHLRRKEPDGEARVVVTIRAFATETPQGSLI